MTKGVGLNSKCPRHGGVRPVMNARDLLQDPEFFHCERFRCNMLRTRCVERQDMEHLRVDRRVKGRLQEFAVVGFPECRDCDQGRAIWSELHQDFYQT